MTLPFVSYGGSSLIAVAYAMGMVLALTRRRPRIRRHRPRPGASATAQDGQLEPEAGVTPAPRPALRRRHRRPSVPGRGAGIGARRARHRASTSRPTSAARPTPRASRRAPCTPSRRRPCARARRSLWRTRPGQLARGTLSALRHARPDQAGRRRRLRRLSDGAAAPRRGLAPHPDRHPRAECRDRPGQPHARPARHPHRHRLSGRRSSSTRATSASWSTPAIRCAPRCSQPRPRPFPISPAAAAPARLRRQPGRARHVGHRAAGRRRRSMPSLRGRLAIVQQAREEDLERVRDAYRASASRRRSRPSSATCRPASRPPISSSPAAAPRRSPSSP